MLILPICPKAQPYQQAQPTPSTSGQGSSWYSLQDNLFSWCNRNISGLRESNLRLRIWAWPITLLVGCTIVLMLFKSDFQWLSYLYTLSLAELQVQNYQWLSHPEKLSTLLCLSQCSMEKVVWPPHFACLPTAPCCPPLRLHLLLEPWQLEQAVQFFWRGQEQRCSRWFQPQHDGDVLQNRVCEQIILVIQQCVANQNHDYIFFSLSSVWRSPRFGIHVPPPLGGGWKGLPCHVGEGC